MTREPAAEAMAAAPPQPAQLNGIDFADLDGWAEDDHSAALRAFRRGAAVIRDYPPKPRPLSPGAVALADLVSEAARLSDDLSDRTARDFFETRFAPFEVLPRSGRGFFTGYYEPIVEGSRARTARFSVPLYRRPDDLVEIDPGNAPAGLDESFRFARRTETGLVSYPDRAAIEAGFLHGRGLELVFVADPVDAFFIHIQGSARIALPERETMRVAYAAKSGHPYTPIGRVLVERGALPRGGATMETIRAWLAAHPEEAAEVMAQNRSFIFFREAPVTDASLGPIAAAKVPLTPGRSLAVDRLLHSFHMPMWIETRLPHPAEGSFRRLMIAQDTGSAIVGPARGDIFLGSGDEAGAVAGAMQAAGRFVVLLPRNTGAR